MVEKDLEKMTATELREEAMKIEGVTGVHAMKKEQLIEIIRKARGLPPKRPRVSGQELGIGEIKAKIRALKLEREAARSSGDRRRVELLRARIKRLKRMTRKLAALKATV